MSLQPRPYAVNPLLGTYFGIFLAGLVAIVILLLILELLGTSDAALRRMLLGGSLVFYAATGALAYTSRAPEFFYAGRRVPAFFTGIIVATIGIGGTGLLAFPGVLFLSGFDGLCLLLGIIAGFVVMAVLVAPFLRKFGAVSVPAYLGLRFESNAVRIAAASVAVPALFLLTIAELKAAVIAAGWLTGVPEAATGTLIALALVVILTPGGVRSLTWSSAAQSIAMLIALLVPVAIIAILLTNLPLGQMSHGPVLRGVTRLEAAANIPISIAPLFGFDIPDAALQSIAGRYASPFSTIGPVAFPMAIVTVMAGIAASPALLPRTSTTVSVYETRKSIGWAIFAAGAAVMTFSTIAVFLRDYLMTSISGLPPARLPAAFLALTDMGIAGIDGTPKVVTAAQVLFKRDGVLLALPVLTGLPAVLVHLVSAGVLGAALAGAGSALTQLGIVLTEDVAVPMQREGVRPWIRLHLTRIVIAVAVPAATSLAVIMPGDPLELMIWSIALAGAGLFPVLLLSIWWKRLTVTGVVAGLSVGTIMPIGAFLAHGIGMIGDGAILVTALTLPLAFAVIVATSMATPAPGRHLLEIVRDLRIPGGETISDRIARQRQMSFKRN